MCVCVCVCVFELNYMTFEGREDFFSLPHPWFYHMLYKYWLKEEDGKVFAGALSSSKVWRDQVPTLINSV